VIRNNDLARGIRREDALLSGMTTI
jgi:hypothetical protein